LRTSGISFEKNCPPLFEKRCTAFIEKRFDFALWRSLQLTDLVGVVAQLVERLNGIQEVRGSNPLGSTSFLFCTMDGLVNTCPISLAIMQAVWQRISPWHQTLFNCRQGVRRN
jgi:hypothetical protein